jgi:hypothetical protein
MHISNLLSPTHCPDLNLRYRWARFYTRGDYTADEPNADETENWLRAMKALMTDL